MGRVERQVPRLSCATSGANAGWVGEPAGGCRLRRSLHLGGSATYASINFITCHDGFTLRDLVSTTPSTTRPTRSSTRRQQRQPVLELRRRRTKPTMPRCGTTPPPHAVDADVAAAEHQGADDLRRRRVRPHPRQQQRLLPGQRISWYDWELDEHQQDLLNFTRQFHRRGPSTAGFHQRFFFSGHSGTQRARGSGLVLSPRRSDDGHRGGAIPPPAA